MTDSLQKVIRLIAKTGDRCIVLDSQGNPAYVLMGLDSYSQLIERKSEVAGMTERELMDKINQDIAEWKAQADTEQNEQSSTPQVENIASSDMVEEPQYDEKAVNQAENEEPQDHYYLEPIE